MAVLNTNWNTDDIALNYIYPTLENVSVLIPGVTINSDVSVEVGGASAFLYKNNSPVVTDGAVGRVLSTNASGNTRVDILLNKSFQIDELIPKAAVETLSVDVVGDYLVKSASAIANAWSKKGLIEMLNGGTSSDGVPSTKDTIYGNIIATIKNFDEANPNRSEGANYLIVTPAVLALLRTSTQFLQTSATAGLLTDGLVGQVGGLSVLLSKQLSTIVAADLSNYQTLTGVEFIVGSRDAFAAPIIFRDFRVRDTELYFGVKVQAELPYGFKVLEPTRIHWFADAAVAA
jgi:hypothetical protein